MSYKAYGGARELWKCREIEILYDGPAGTGKTRAVCEKADAIARRWPNSRILFIRKTRASLIESVLVTYESKVLPQKSLIKSGQKRSHRQSYPYPNGSIIVTGGLDNVDRIMSTEYDLICLFEATEATEDDWQKLLTRLRNNVLPFQQAIADCNPSNPKHWLKVRSDNGFIHRISSRHEDNPSITPQYIETLKKLTGHRRARLFEGKWCAAEGLVYDMWDESKFVKKPDNFIPVRTIVGIDEGYTNPCSKHLYHIDNDGRMYVVTEDYKRGQLEKDVVDCVKKWYTENAKTFEAAVIDPSAAKLIAALRNESIPVREANNSIFDGIKAVQERFQIAGDGKPRIYIDPGCKHMIDEIEGYSWKENKDGSHIDRPVKENDHACDELRYVSMYLSENSGRFEVIAI